MFRLLRPVASASSRLSDIVTRYAPVVLSPKTVAAEGKKRRPLKQTGSRILLNIEVNMKDSAMKKMIYKSGVFLALWLVSTNQVFSQQVETPYLHIPGTISGEAQALLRALPDPNLGPAFPDPDELDKWKAAQQAAEAHNLEMQRALVDRLQPNVTKRDFGGVPVLDIRPEVGKSMARCWYTRTVVPTRFKVLRRPSPAVRRSRSHRDSCDIR